jgi:hypothetical protein
MASVQWDRNNSTTEPPTISWACIRNALIGSVFCWGFIIGCGWLGYKLSHYV